MPRKAYREQTPLFSDSRAYVYIATNPLLVGMCKIGFSNRDPKDRVAEFNCAGLPKRYKLRWYIFTSQGAEQLEKAVHRELKIHNITPDSGCGKEWFMHGVEEAIRIVAALADTLKIEVIQTQFFDDEPPPPVQQSLPVPPTPSAPKSIADSATIENRIAENSTLLIKKRRAGLDFVVCNGIMQQIKNGEVAICDCLIINLRPYPHSVDPVRCYHCNKLIER